ncbi:MAG: hypothetical protein M3N19_07625 [Candidatus Eremiobacteraeota bacterium]|nr:hypothetical protein [Candidatus Eremiobacteraeota bacterium]
MSSTALERFQTKVERVVDQHPIVQSNPYTAWFATGAFTLDELRDFTVQFSVFSHLFLEAQLRKCINAGTLESYRASKEILLNELGVSFGGDGSVEGARFRFSAAHFEWLLEFGRHLGLHFSHLGKRAQGSPATLTFCDTLTLVYGSENPSTAAGASYAIEHWAAAGFWKELIAGLRFIKHNELPDLPLGFWTWHDAIEDRHAEHTAEELHAAFALPGFEEGAFVSGARAVLDAVAGFWSGLADATIMTKVA